MALTNSKYIKIGAWLVIIALILTIVILIFNAYAEGGETGPPFDIPPGLSTTPPGNPNVSKPSVKLCLTIVGLNNPNQRLSYIWDESLDNGVTWHEWAGSSLIGGTYFDKPTGKPTNRFCLASVSPTVADANALLRLRTNIIGPGLSIALEANDK